MIVREITIHDWQAILQIQADAYFEIQPESVTVLQSKWKLSQSTCVVVEEQQRILAYCLAHPWSDNSAPPLFHELTHIPQQAGLFIHDLAIHSSARGRGIGRLIFNYLHQQANRHHLQFFSLVAIQDATHFWQKLGFQVAPLDKSLHSYGKNPVYMKRHLITTA
ncbi:acetyltransferase [Beggiatoa alba B18LD]|uniref:Acetyltransferase n=1 Tax=Beggiatoa alba B18LD TaxID=395493 RepID=I3CH19_9GAMM|nr:GNAT family N-acetyltransferase [Beggiatoa alba]EIJ42912.1 acetyltransferase [Beggiatoa alba B18LD]